MEGVCLSKMGCSSVWNGNLGCGLVNYRIKVFHTMQLLGMDWIGLLPKTSSGMTYISMSSVISPDSPLLLLAP